MSSGCTSTLGKIGNRTGNDTPQHGRSRPAQKAICPRDIRSFRTVRQLNSEAQEILTVESVTGLKPQRCQSAATQTQRREQSPTARYCTTLHCTDTEYGPKSGCWMLGVARECSPGGTPGWHILSRVPPQGYTPPSYLPGYGTPSYLPVNRPVS